MKHKVEKCVQLIQDLMIYYYGLGAENIKVDFTPSEESCKIGVSGKIKDLSKETFHEIEKAFRQTRRHDVEELYWAITYDVDSPCEVTQLGMLFDESKVSYQDELLTIEGIRY